MPDETEGEADSAEVEEAVVDGSRTLGTVSYIKVTSAIEPNPTLKGRYDGEGVL